jgi:hypothetical protein
VSALAVAGTGYPLSTWLFLGALGGASLLVVPAYGRAISGWSPPEGRTDLVSPEHFTRMRGIENEVDLGRGWRATDDPGAAWHLYWVPRSGDIVGVRTSELPPPPGPFYLGGIGTRSPLDAYGVQKFTGMKVLGRSGDRPTKALCDELRPRPDGLDVLTGGTRSGAWLDGDDDAEDLASEWTVDDDG